MMLYYIIFYILYIILYLSLFLLTAFVFSSLAVAAFASRPRCFFPSLALCMHEGTGYLLGADACHGKPGWVGD